MRGECRSDTKMRCEGLAYFKGITKLLNFGSVCGGVSINWFISQTSPPRKVSLQTSFEWKTTPARNYRWATFWLCLMWYWSAWTPARILFQLSSHIKKYCCDVGNLMKQYAGREKLLFSLEDCSYQAIF